MTLYELIKTLQEIRKDLLSENTKVYFSEDLNKRIEVDDIMIGTDRICLIGALGQEVPYDPEKHGSGGGR